MKISKTIKIGLLSLVMFTSLSACKKVDPEEVDKANKVDVVSKVDVMNKLTEEGYKQIDGTKPFELDNATITIEKVSWGDLTTDYKKYGLDEDVADSLGMNTIGKVTYKVKNNGSKPFTPFMGAIDKDGKDLTVSTNFSAEHETGPGEESENVIIFFSKEKTLDTIYFSLNNLDTDSGVAFPLNMNNKK